MVDTLLLLYKRMPHSRTCVLWMCEQSILHQTRNTMTSQQFQRFLTWTSDNKDVIDQLQVRTRVSARSQRSLTLVAHNCVL